MNEDASVEWLEETNGGWAAEFEVTGTSGKGKYKVGDHIWILCSAKGLGSPDSKLANFMKFCPDGKFSVQLKCLDSSCMQKAYEDVYHAVSKCY